ncbi:hypothetical protein V6N11_028590 [Hibiscus sabdariffa]|uniref:Uncharacterized protein n=1 Tax=Hibiscus sabdariffa TaxID=183260 RepID=A0ABR2NA23_9ROSI
MYSGVASSNWASGGDDGVLGVEPNGESGVVCLLARMAVGVEVGLGTEVSCGVVVGVDWASVGANGPASSGAAAGSLVESRDDKGKSENAFVVLAGSCNLLGDDFSHVEAVARHDDVYQYQPSAVNRLIVGGQHQIPFYKGVPQFGFWP